MPGFVCAGPRIRGPGSLLWALDVVRIVQGTNVEWSEQIRLAHTRRFALILADALGVISQVVPLEVLRALAELPVSPLEALEYVDSAGCPGPWAASARRASWALRELRRHSDRLDDASLAEEAQRIRMQWDPAWPALWQRPERTSAARP